MEHLELSETHKRILDMLVMGRSYKEIAEQLKISKLTLYAYIRDMNRNNQCNIYQLIWKYAHIGTDYTTVKTK